MNEFVAVSTTIERRALLETIALTLVDERLAACAQIEAPIDSIYRWHGAIERAHEWRCTFKTRASLFDAVAARIAELHEYEVPEIVALPLANVSEGYARWLRESTREPEPKAHEP